MSILPSLRQQYGAYFSRSAHVTIDDEQYIMGKWGRISQNDDGSYDVWFVLPNLSPLSPQKMAAIRKSVPQEWDLVELTGEMWIQGRGRDFVLTAAALAGVKKKRRVAPGFKVGVAT